MYMIYSSIRSWAVADFAYRDSILRYENGLITGDFIMTLPPMSNIKLNSYTG